MVTVVSFLKRQNTAGKDFFLLVLQGAVEVVKSTVTGNFYATARKTTITSTFDEATCTSLIGTKLPGIIEKTPSAPYEYKLPDTGETIMISHKYNYNPNPNLAEETVFQPEITL